MDIEIALIPYFAEAIVSEKPDKVLELQFSALRQLQARLSGTTHLRRFQPIPVIADDLIVEDEYGKVYSLDEFETHMKESYPALSRTEVEGMVRMMKRWEEQYRPS